MRTGLSLLLFLILCTCTSTPLSDHGPAPEADQVVAEIPLNSNFAADDVLNFWEAYDLVVAARDSAEQASILESKFFAKGTPGLAGIMQARRYTKEEYRQAINNYPKFWTSMRASMLRAPALITQIKTAAEQLHAIYPSAVKADVYLTVGCFRTNGTVLDSLVLFGTELCMANEEVDLSEWDGPMLNIKPYMESNPVSGLSFLAVHEYTHSRQPVQNGYNLLGEALYEGIPEFVATIASGQASSTPAIAYGEANEQAVKSAFSKDIGSPFIYDWLQNSTENAFETRDLGYYIGYAMAKRYYEAATDKSLAIKEMIELDYQDSLAVSGFVDQTEYFAQPVDELLTAYANRQPVVTAIRQFTNGATDVDAAITQITLELDKPLDNYWKNTRLGPGGEATVPKIDGLTTAEDGLSITYDVTLEPGRRYEFELGPGYLGQNGARLRPFLVTFQTAE